MLQLKFKCFVVALFSVVLFQAPLRAASPDDWKLHGLWSLHRAVGSPCRELINDIAYTFEPDGSYVISASMNRMGGIKNERAEGTYELVQGTILGKVNGIKVGPFPYRFEGDYLVIQETNPTCLIYLTKDEER